MAKPMLVQYSIEFPNDPGVHAKVSRLLLYDKIDFQSMVTTRAGGKTVIRFLAAKNALLSRRLHKMGIAAREEAVYSKAGADKDINVLSLYSVVEGDNMRIVLAVERPSDAAVLIEKLGYNPDESAPD